MYTHIKTLYKKIQHNKPLILNLSNAVTMQWVANGLLSLGASPIMSQEEGELEDLLKISLALVVNIGTITHDFIQLCHRAIQLAAQHNVPVILDPVGAGASELRTRSSLDFLEKYPIAIVKGNASEISALARKSDCTRGVDSHMSTRAAIDAGVELSHQYRSTVVISGKEDAVITGEVVEHYNIGSNMLTSITGAGCLLAAVSAAFHAVCTDTHKAASNALIFYTVASELAEKKCFGPGTFAQSFLDQLSYLPEEENYVERINNSRF